MTMGSAKKHVHDDVVLKNIQLMKSRNHSNPTAPSVLIFIQELKETGSHGCLSLHCFATHTST